MMIANQTEQKKRLKRDRDTMVLSKSDTLFSEESREITVTEQEGGHE